MGTKQQFSRLKIDYDRCVVNKYTISHKSMTHVMPYVILNQLPYRLKENENVGLAREASRSAP